MSDFFAAILAGGQSLRFGQDKALLKVEGIYLLDYIYSQLTSITTQIRVIGQAREDVSVAPSLFVPDRIKDLGPLGGLFTSLQLSSEPVLLVPCDMPFLKSIHIEFLIQNFDASYDATIAVSGKGIEPLLGIYSIKILPRLQKFIERKEFALYKFLKSLNTKYVDFEENDDNSLAFFNINTLSDYKKALYLKEQIYVNN